MVITSSISGKRSRHHETYLMANPSKFEKTTCKTIALELREYTPHFSGKVIDPYSMDQLIRVLNYAHDQGGRRIILINQTSYSAEQLLIQIKAQLPKSERERTWSRLMLLLCETEDSIFKYDQSNGHIEIAIQKDILTEQLSIQEEEFLIEHRHDLAELQHEYDKQFGLMVILFGMRLEFDMVQNPSFSPR